MARALYRGRAHARVRKSLKAVRAESYCNAARCDFCFLSIAAHRVPFAEFYFFGKHHNFIYSDSVELFFFCTLSFFGKYVSLVYPNLDAYDTKRQVGALAREVHVSAERLQWYAPFF